MKPAPNWKSSTDPVDGVWKQDLLRWLGQVFNIRTLIETGTCQGSTPAAVFKDFDHIWGCELSERYWNQAVTRLNNLEARNVVVAFSDSRQFLEHLLPRLPKDERLLFWLDAHPCGGFSADAGNPLPKEIEIITCLRPDSLVVIDDMEPDFPARTDCDLTGWYLEYRTGEVIMHRGGYEIPPFEYDTEFCTYCGSGLGKFRRFGEGTCQLCWYKR